MVQVSSLMRQMTKGNSSIGGYGDLISPAFNSSIVNATASRFKVDPTRTPLKIAVRAFQANYYYSTVPNIESQYTRSVDDLLGYLVTIGRISGKPYKFPDLTEKLRQSFRAGDVFEFSTKQLELINAPTPRNQIIWNEGSIRSGKTSAIGVKMCARWLSGRKPKNHACIGYSHTVLSRIILDNPMGIMTMIPWAKRVSGTESTKVVFNSLIEDTHGNYSETQVYLVSGVNSRSSNVILGLNLSSLWIEEINTIAPEVLIEANNRQIADDEKFTIASCNPIQPNSSLLSYIRLFNGNKEETNVSNANFAWWHWTFEDNPVLTESMKQAIRDQYAHDIYLTRTKCEGLRSLPENLVIHQFNENHLLYDLPLDFQKGTLKLHASCDPGYADSFVFQITLVGWRQGKPFAVMVAEYSHKPNKHVSMKGVSVANLSPEEHTLNTLTAFALVKRALERYYPKERYGAIQTETLVVDPSAKSEINQYQRTLDALHLPELFGLHIKKANNNGNDAHKVKNKGKGAGVEVGFTELNRSLFLGRLKILRNMECLGIGDQLDTRHCVEEVNSYVRDQGNQLILTSTGHFDSPHAWRYQHNELKNEYWWGD